MFTAVLVWLAFSLGIQQEFQFEMGRGTIAGACDVAVFAPCNSEEQWAFVADTSSHSLHQYRIRANEYELFRTYNADFGPDFNFGDGPYAVAVNDMPWDTNFGQVYVSWTHPNPWEINDGVEVYTIKLNSPGRGDLEPYGRFVGDAFVPIARAEGLCVDSEGSLFVLDYSIAIYKLNSDNLANKTWYSYETYYQLGTFLDISVNQSGIMHLLNTSSDAEIEQYTQDGQFIRLIQTREVNSAGGVSRGSGIDCHSPDESVWISMQSISGPGTVGANRWDRDLSGVEERTGPGYLIEPAGLEWKARWSSRRLNTSYSSPAKVLCRQSLFVADRAWDQLGNSKVVVFSEDAISVALPENAVAWWRFEGKIEENLTVRDTMGRNHGTVVGTVRPQQKLGHVRCGLEFEGGSFAWDSGVHIPDAPSLDFDINSFSIEGWIRTEAAGGIRTILDKRDSATGYHLYILNGQLGAQLMTGGAYRNFAASNPAYDLMDDNWHHFAVVFERANSLTPATKLFVDGDLIATDTQPLAGSVSNGADLLLGKHRDSANGMTGTLDEVTLYARALTEAEIAGIHAAGRAGKDLPAAQYQVQQPPVH